MERFSLLISRLSLPRLAPWASFTNKARRCDHIAPVTTRGLSSGWHYWIRRPRPNNAAGRRLTTAKEKKNSAGFRLAEWERLPIVGQG